MINLFICYDTNSWESNSMLMPRDRSLTEYIMPELKSRFSVLDDDAIKQLRGFPCVFAYEQVHRKDAYIGQLIDVSLRQLNIKVDYLLSGEKIRYNDFISISDLLDVGSWELNRTHWTLKNIMIDELRPFFSNRTSHRPTVFISYSWTPIQNQQYVFELAAKLKYDGITVIYDKKDLFPGQDIDFFMENVLTTEKVDHVLVICNRDYAEKADKRRGGVGYESEIILGQIHSQPMQRKVIPIVIEKDINGNPYLPLFLKSRLYVDITKEAGYNELLSYIIGTN